MQMSDFPFHARTEWQWWVTPKPLHNKPIHRWYILPHSFSSELVHALIDEWRLGKKDRILDPFVGAGTTLLAAKERGIPATGYDLSPLAVLAAQAKIATYDVPSLEKAWTSLRNAMDAAPWDRARRDYPELVRAALPGKLLGGFEAIALGIERLPNVSSVERDFFSLALLRTIPQYSRAIATGGWLKWRRGGKKATSLRSDVEAHVREMINDLKETKLRNGSGWNARLGDARQLPDRGGRYSAVITSPPYPNRHDYTRVFGVELMFGFLNWEQTRQLRYQNFHSHPEARPTRREHNGYVSPQRLSKAIASIQKARCDPRIPRLLDGYFLDMFLCLREAKRVCQPGSPIAFVVGNAQYNGVPIPVDGLTAELGEQAGLGCETIVVARLRGNSAQQMGEYGRRPSRESVVIFRALREQ
jgi:hypothetical protein